MTMVMTSQPARTVPVSLALAGRSFRSVAETSPGAMPPDLRFNPLMQALDALDDGLILTDAASSVVYANRTARAFCTAGPLMVRKGLLCAGTSTETLELQSRIAASSQREAAAAFLRLSVPGGRRHLMVTVTASDSTQGVPGENPTVLVLIRDGRSVVPPSAQMIGTFFGLTPAESRLACEMIKGDGLKACAKRLGITPNTARTHLNRVFDKTGTKRQAELVHLLFSCRCSIGCDRPEREP